MCCFSALQRAENSSNALRYGQNQHEDLFQCSSASRKFLKLPRTANRAAARLVSVLFSEPKIPQRCCRGVRPSRVGRVSVLFSEPKIPQIGVRVRVGVRVGVRFSALQRAENSSKRPSMRAPKVTPSFSALQRAENSSKRCECHCCIRIDRFQCSSASRKFLKACGRRQSHRANKVSVLFSEPKIPQSVARGIRVFHVVSFQCSSASRKFLKFQGLQGIKNYQHVSVLFSEPKIPQTCYFSRMLSRNNQFQCSSASRKFLKLSVPITQVSLATVSVLFSEPKIPQIC